LSIQKIPFEPNAVVQSVVSIMETRARARGLTLMCDMASSLPPRLAGDPDRLHQVLLNLVGNAVKFTEQGSVRLLVTGVVENGSAMLTFSVADTGIGIPAEKQAVIFEPFTQADSSITRQYGGTGLGLTISRQLVDLMEGRMWLESELGRGSTFSFSVTFPVLEPVVPAAPVETPAAVPGVAMPRTPAPERAESPREILLVDDSQDNVFLIQEFLKDSPYVVDVAENGMDALTKVQTRHYDLVLMDVQMPVIDGHTATRVIRAWESENHTTPVPILALTAHALRSEVEKSMQAGCNAHLSKPIQRQALLAALAEYTGTPPIERVTVTPPVGFEDLSRDYLARRKEGMATLRGMLERGDYDRIRRAAHDVKGTGASYGFAVLTDVARLLEQAAAAQDLARMERALRSMDTYLQSVEIATAPGSAPPAQATTRKAGGS
jgi:CheY-like chemotaxis protein/HPt (histidine-containing phosphotransfer) domain-containing protein